VSDARDVPDIRPLADAVSGAALGPGDDGWDAARQAWNLAADQRPAAVVQAAGEDDVVATVGFAREHGLRVAAQSTGHAASGIASLDGTILLRTVRMAGVEVDAGARRARAEAGALWADVAARAGEHGLAALHGSAGQVGVVGYTLGGGFGWLGRLHGLAANSAEAFEVVTADGRVVRADRESEPELFWALRGGGGSFGVVTAIEFRLYELATAYAGMLAWPAERASEVLHAYREWTAGLPDEMTAWARLLTAPPLPAVPEPLRGVPVVDVTVAFAGPEAEGAELLRPLLELGEPLVNMLGTVPAPALSAINGDPEDPVPAVGDGDLLAGLPAEAVDELIRVAGPGSGSPLLMVQVRHLGGALGRAPEGAGALPRLDAEYAVYSVGMAMDAAGGAAVAEQVRRVQDALRPWAAGTRYLNFVDVPAPAALLWDEDTSARLGRARAEYDPDGTFRANHEVAPAV
jgi:hypothetical protein